jgi:hypothetical protein
VDCPLCGTEDALTPARVGYIRGQVANTAAFQQAETRAREALNQLAGNLRTLETNVGAAYPPFLGMSSQERRKAGFTVSRVCGLIPEHVHPCVSTWMHRLRLVLTRKKNFLRATSKASNLLSKAMENLEAFVGPEPLEAAFRTVGDALAALEADHKAYLSAEAELLEKIKAVVDAKSQTTGWESLIDLARRQDQVRESLVERRSREALRSELAQALKQIDKGNEQVLDDKFSDLTGAVETWWNLLRPDEPTFFSGVKPRPGARRTIDFKAGLSPHVDRSNPKIRDVIAVFSQSQLHCLGLALFLARAQHENAGFVVLDDPILASDDDYRAHFSTSVLEHALEIGMQVILLTQDQRTWKDIEERYLHKGINVFQIELRNPADGADVTSTSDDMACMLSKVETLARGGHADLRRQAGEVLRNAVERFCKLLLVKDNRAKGDKSAVLSDYDNKMSYKDLGPLVEPLLTADPSHPGKLRATNKACGPGKHDQAVPDRGTLQVGVGDLRALKKQYLD